MAGLEESSEHTPLAEVADLAERRRGGSVTIYDVAESAGVHPSTVSRAFSSPGRVSARTELRIREVAKELGFRFNPMARALPSGKTHTLGLVVADITNPMVFDIISRRGTGIACLRVQAHCRRVARVWRRRERSY